MAPLEWSIALPDDRVAHVRVTDRNDGDLSVQQDPAQVEPRRRAVMDQPWVWLRQVHGSDLVVAEHAGQGAGTEADAALTTRSAVPVVAHMADCAPVGFVGVAPGGETAVAAAHAGWRGLEAGVLATTAARLREFGMTDLRAVLGPCIHAECYEFGTAELDRLSNRWGSAVVGTTAQGTPALNMPAAVAAELDAHGVPLVAHLGGCTACEGDLRWSYRARGEMERQAMVVWLEEASAQGRP